MPPKTEEQRYDRWVKTVSECHRQGWQYAWQKNIFIFFSPSNTLHDLSAADLTKLDSIEENGNFLVD